MNTLRRLVLTTALLALLAGCGDDPPSAVTSHSASRRDRVKSALEALFADVRAGDNAAAAARILYKGKDAARTWKSVCDYTDDHEKRQVDLACKHVKRALGEGPVEFVEFKTQPNRYGELLAWVVETSAGKTLFACLDLDGTIALGDVDHVE